MRAEFSVKHVEGSLQYVMFKKGDKRTHFVVDQFTPAHINIQRLMPRLKELVNQNETLKTKLFQVEFLTSRQDENLVTLIYHRPLDEQWEADAKALAKQLGCHIIGRSRKQKIIIGKHYIYETFKVGNKLYKYQQVEASFTQPNALICEAMLNWAYEQVENQDSSLLELYCGNGNFTLPLSRRFKQVLATEISKTSIDSAKHNCEINNIDNIEFARLSSEEMTDALNKARPFRRLKHIDLDSYNFSHIFVDPPRAGLDEQTRKLVSEFDSIIYISCNPTTLERDIKQLAHTHKIKRFAFFDQFPLTHHCECGVVLNRK